MKHTHAKSSSLVSIAKMHALHTAFARLLLVGLLLGQLCLLRVGAQEPNRKNTSPGYAKSVIEIWLWGGPSQLETFDPKPDAGKEYNNGLKAIPTNVEGVQISEMLPKLAQQADDESSAALISDRMRIHEKTAWMLRAIHQ